MAIRYSVQPDQKFLLLASNRGIIVKNNTKQIISFQIFGQILTTPARELAKIAYSPSTDIEFLKEVARQIYMELLLVHAADIDNGSLAVHVVSTTPVRDDGVNYQILYTQKQQ
jgi:hypothetical protein